MARDSKGKQRADDRADNEQMDMDPSQSQSQSAHRATPSVHGSARRSKSSKGKGRARQDEDGDDGEEDQKMASDDDNNDQEEDGDEEMEESNTAKTKSKTKGPGNAGLDGAYDPKQNVVEKRKVRRDYRDLTTNLMADRSKDPDGITTQSLRSGLDRVNELFNAVKTPAEAVLDSNFLMLTGDLALHQARKLKIGGDYFDTEDFLAKIKTVIMGGALGGAARKGRGVAQNGTPGRGSQGGRGRGSNRRDDSDAEEDDEEEDEALATSAANVYRGWDRIGRLATKYTYRVPPIDFMLGPLAIPQKVRVVKEKKAKEAKTVSKETKTMTREDLEQDTQETTKLVRHVRDILEREGGEDGMNLFKFLINPDSYGQTVENLFYFSFIIKDGKACIDLKNNEPVIYSCEPADDEQKAEGAHTSQLIIELDKKMWEDAIEAYDITESTIPTRVAQERTAGKWYA